jgi:ribose transport system substrate-binding protein
MGLRRARGFVASGVALTLVVLVGGCGSDRAGPSADPSAGPSGSRPPVDVLTESRNVLTRFYKGTYSPPDSTTRIAAKGKKIAIISPSQASASFAQPASGAKEAAEELGWTVYVLDAQSDPKRVPGLVREAISLGVDGIISGVDCGYAPDAFAEAKAKAILIAPLYSFDCTDPTVAGAPGPSQFTTFVNYGNQQIDNSRFLAGAGAVAASALIAKTNGTANAMAFTDPTSTILTYTTAGFVAQIKRCAGCKMLEVVNLVIGEPPAVLQAKVRAALDRHPEVNAIRVSHSTALQQAVAPALVAAGRQNDVLVIGGEGLNADLDLIRTKQGLNLTLNTDAVWFGWAVVDTVNSAFNGEKPRPNGLGGMIIDKEHNLPPSGSVTHNINFKSIYRKAWGVG